MRRTLLRSFPSGEIRPTDETAEVKSVFAHWDMSAGIARRPRPPLRAKIPRGRSRPTLELQEITSRYVSGDRAGASAKRAARSSRLIPTCASRCCSSRTWSARPATCRRRSRRSACAAIHPGDVEAASLLGASLTRANRSDEAIEVLHPYAAAADADVQVLVTLGLAQARSGRLAEARATLDRARQAIRRMPCSLVTSGTIELMAGIVERRLGRRSRRRSRSIPRPHVRTARSVRSRRKKDIRARRSSTGGAPSRSILPSTRSC